MQSNVGTIKQLLDSASSDIQDIALGEVKFDVTLHNILDIRLSLT